MYSPKGQQPQPSVPAQADAFLSLFGESEAASEERLRRLFHGLGVYFSLRQGADAADDLVQETMSRAYFGLPKIAGLTWGRPEHYIYGIARHVLHESVRRQRHFCRSWSDDKSLENLSSGSPENDRALLVEQCLAALSPEDRDLVLKYYSGEADDLRRERGLSAGALRVQVHRVTQRLRTKLGTTPSEKATIP